MANPTRNQADVLRDKIARQITVTPPPSPLNAEGIGTAPTGTFALAFRDGNGAAKKWFKWGKHSFDDEDAIVY